jgi:hypothetical protein
MFNLFIYAQLLSEALTLADEDIKENWKACQKAFLEGR